MELHDDEHEMGELDRSDLLLEGLRELTRCQGLGRRAGVKSTPADRVEQVTFPNERSESYSYDSTGYLTQSTQAPGTTVTQVHDAANRLESRTLTYDPAQNRTAAVVQGSSEPRKVSETPPGSQNRPTSLGGVPLLWNAAGNLSQKGDRQHVYDWRNRLVRVTTTQGVDLASYAYDVFDRLVQRTAGASTEETVWAGWQPIELYRGGQLAQRRTYGPGIDEIVRLEVDLDGAGGLEQTYTPLYDQTGNLVAVTDPAGKIVERYEYSPYGLRLATVDSIPPEIRQLLLRDGDLRLDLSEEILRRSFQLQTSQSSSLAEGLAAKDGTTEPPPLSLVVTATGEEIPVEVDFPVELGRFAFRRATITPTGTPPAVGTEVTLRIEAEAVQDTFFNAPGQAFETTFSWSAGETVLEDTTPPEVEEITTRGGHLEIGFSEEVDLATAQSAITIDGQAASWQLDATGYRLRTVDPLDPAAQSLTVGTGVQDLAGLGLPTALTVDLTDPIATADPEPIFSSVAELEAKASGDLTAVLRPRLFEWLVAPDSIIYRVAEANQILTSTTGNRFGFHGREIDFATGLVYFRHRWYDPEMGRFLQQDPLGYVDGPNLYQYGLNNPASFSDPLGLLCVGKLRNTRPCRAVTDGLTYFWFGDLEGQDQHEEFVWQQRLAFYAEFGEWPEGGDPLYWDEANGRMLEADGRWHDYSGRIEANHHELLLVGGGAGAAHAWRAARMAGASVPRQMVVVSGAVADEVAGEVVGVNPSAVRSLVSRGGLNGRRLWGRADTLDDHFRRHGADFGATSADDYAQQASDFFQRSQADRLPTKIGPDGTIRVYDPLSANMG